jgi:hypothetical protein
MAAKKPDPLGELALKFVHALEAQRALGPDSYPVPLGRLVELADTQATPESIAKAVGKAQFKKRAQILAKDKSDAAPLVILRDDLEQLAARPALLEQVLESLSMPDKALVPVSSLKTKPALAPALRKSLAASVLRRITEGSLPSTVGFLTLKGKPYLYLKRLMPELEVSEQLLRVLESQRSLGPDSYPSTVQRLFELAAPGAPEVLREKAIAAAPFQDRVILAQTGKAAAPVALREDTDRLMASPQVWEFVLKAARTDKTTAFPVAALQKELATKLRKSFAATADRIPPPMVGWLLIKGKKQFFLLEDVQGGRLPAPGTRTVEAKPVDGRPPLADFARAFQEGFDQLDRQHGAHNFVSLVELRRAIPCDRPTFDAELRKLRIAGRYTLSAAEGRHGITPEEQQAGIREEGSLLLFVSRKAP